MTDARSAALPMAVGWGNAKENEKGKQCYVYDFSKEKKCRDHRKKKISSSIGFI
jgi:hypothetical protein